MEEARQWSKEIVDLRKTVIPKVVSMEKERMRLEFERVMECGNRIVESATSKPEAAEMALTKLPEITAWEPPFDDQQLCQEIRDIKRMSAHLKAQTASFDSFLGTD